MKRDGWISNLTRPFLLFTLPLLAACTHNKACRTDTRFCSGNGEKAINVNTRILLPGGNQGPRSSL